MLFVVGLCEYVYECACFLVHYWFVSLYILALNYRKKVRGEGWVGKEYTILKLIGQKVWTIETQTWKPNLK